MAKSTKTKITKVLSVTTEALPFAATGGMGEVCSALPGALNKTKKVDARVIMPLYEEVAFNYKSKMTFVCNITVSLSWRNQYCGLFEMDHDGVKYYFIDNEYYFKRPNLY
ncbi:MAG: glycogen/starch synthase, partial [Clostridiales bacterium]|nr:glycogen/starch synthase [Clostridiales bacterium]